MFYIISRIIIKFLVLFISSINTCQWSPNQCGCARIAPSINNRIVGGTEAIPHSWPWMVSIRKFDGHICGGVLISNQHILTAAHCFPNYSPTIISYYSFAIGHHGIRERNIVLTARNITIHPLYNINGRNINDIALIQLNQLVDFTNDQLGFICLPLNHTNDGSFPPIGTETWVIGWGTTSYEGLLASGLMQVSVPITNNQGCLDKVTAPSKQICAGYDEGGKDSCQGDSGGPLLLDNGEGIFILIGLVSFGERCADYMKPGIYTRVSAFTDWIENVINEQNSLLSNDIPLALSFGILNQQISYFIFFIVIFIFESK